LIFTLIAGCDALEDVVAQKTFACDLRTSEVVESPQCMAFDNIREADGSATQVRAFCLGLQSELVKGDCPLDDALISCVAAGALIPEPVRALGVSLVITDYADSETEEERLVQIEAKALACEEAGGSVVYRAD
jgi:hypothetical protein